MDTSLQYSIKFHIFHSRIFLIIWLILCLFLYFPMNTIWEYSLECAGIYHTLIITILYSFYAATYFSIVSILGLYKYSIFGYYANILTMIFISIFLSSVFGFNSGIPAISFWSALIVCLIYTSIVVFYYKKRKSLFTASNIISENEHTFTMKWHNFNVYVRLPIVFLNLIISIFIFSNILQMYHQIYNEYKLFYTISIICYFILLPLTLITFIGLSNMSYSGFICNLIHTIIFCLYNSSNIAVRSDRPIYSFTISIFSFTLLISTYFNYYLKRRLLFSSKAEKNPIHNKTQNEVEPIITENISKSLNENSKQLRKAKIKKVNKK